MGDELAGEAPVMALFEPTPEPLTSREVADELGCARTTAYKKLQRLADRGILRTKKVGARGRVWWLPGAPATAGGESTSDGELGREGLDPGHPFQAVFEEAFDAMLIADDAGRYVDANPAACDLFGLPKADLLGQTAADFAAEDYDVERAWQEFLDADLDRGLFPLVRPDGETRIAEFAATPGILPDRNLSILRDVTAQQQTRAALSEERERSQQYQRSLTAEQSVGLDIVLPGDTVFGAAGAGVDWASEFEGAAHATDGRLLEYVTVAGATGEEITDLATEAATISDCRVVAESDDATLVELVLAESPVATLLEAGATCRSLHSADGTTTVVAEIGTDADLPALVEAFSTAFPDAEVVAKRTLDRPVATTRQYRDAIARTLTVRQTETLRAAHLAGYYEWPRHSDAGEIAASMGIATSTWLRHLRRAESALVGWFFEELEA